MIFVFIISILFVRPLHVMAPASSVSPPSHELWNNLLSKYVSPEGKVNYKGIKAEEVVLSSYLDILSKNAPGSEWSKNEQMAYWINCYNANTVKLILNHYPVKSIREIEGGKPWSDPFITIGEKKYSLDNIEHNILRKNFTDPRIHFAVNCASKSCPKLMNEAFRADRLDSQLNALAKAFINDSSKNTITREKIAISPLFNWYKEDFTSGLIDFLNEYSNTKISSEAQISYVNYDWSLNE